MVKKALYLAGGGARGAYQAGVLKGISHILQTKTLPFAMISGVSVGSINGAVIAQHADDFSLSIEKLENLWNEIRCQQIFNTSNYALGKSVLSNLSGLLVKQRQAGHLLDTSPLLQFINEHIDFQKIRANISKRHLETIEIISHCYETQQTISFYEHMHEQFENWDSPRHVSSKVDIDKDHMLASSALPLFFPTVKINGFHYGDGGLGLVSPLRGAIRFQVEKILIIGTRQAATAQELAKNNNIGFAHILGNMLDGVFLDNLDRDIEMVNHMNDIARLLSLWKKWRSPWRPIQTLYIRPSANIAAMAQSKFSSIPTMLRFMLNTLGAKHQSGDLLSFLLFEREFTQDLLNLGYKDALNSELAIKAFFQDR